MKIFLTSYIFLLTSYLSAQTGTISVDQNHTGHRVYGLPVPTDTSDAATKAYVDAHGGGGGGSVSLTATSPIIVTPSPVTGTGVVSLDSTSKTNWDLAFTQTRQWDGGSTGLVAATGRTSLGLVIGTNVQAYDADLDALAALSGTHNIYYRSASNTWSSVTIGTGLDFTGATLSATSSGGNLSNTGTPVDNQVAVFTDATHVEGNSNLSFDSSTNILSTGIVSPVTGFRINGAAANRRILVGNATNFVQSTETYAVPGTSGNVMQSDGTNWTSAQLGFSALSGNWTLAQGPSTTASKLLGRTDASAGIPQEITLGTNLAISGTTLNATGGSTTFANPTAKVGTTVVNGSATTAMRSDAAPPIDKTIDLTMNANQSVTVTDGNSATPTDLLTLDHELASGASVGFGSAILFRAKDASVANNNIGRIAVIWGDATNATHRSAMDFQLDFNGSSPASAATIYQQSGGGSLSVGSTTNPGAVGIINASSGYWVANAVSTSGKILQSDGSKFTASTPTWPALAGAAGYTPRSDGSTGFASYPAQLVNSSVSAQSPSTADVYLAGSNIVVTAGDFKAKGQYKCVFDMTKSAGTGAIVITLRVGTAGTTADAAIQTYTFGAGTSVADTGIFEVIATWRTVGSGTSAVMQGICRGTHLLATTGLFNNAAGWVLIGSPSPSSGFASNAATNIGISFNGSTAFAGTAQVVQAQLQQ